MFGRREKAAYRLASVEGVTHLGLLLVVYDHILVDLHRAAKAADLGRIADRCNATNQALLLLAYAESWVDLLDDAELAGSLKNFYRYVRGQLTTLQIKGKGKDFDELAYSVQTVRAAWQKKEQSVSARSSEGDNAKSVWREEAPSLVREVPSAWCA